MACSKIKYRAGEKILAGCVPYIHAVRPQFKGKVCDACLSSTQKLSQCSKCLSVWYCSKECQRRDWFNVHKYECPYHPLSLEELSHPKLIYLILRYHCKPEIDPRNSTGVDYDVFQTFDGQMIGQCDLGFKLTMKNLNGFKFDVDIERNKYSEEEGRLFGARWLELEEPDDGADKQMKRAISKAQLCEYYSIPVTATYQGREETIADGLYLEAVPAIDKYSKKPTAIATFNGLALDITATVNIKHNQKPKIYIPDPPYIQSFSEDQIRAKLAEGEDRDNPWGDLNTGLQACTINLGAQRKPGLHIHPKSNMIMSVSQRAHL